MKKRNKKLPMGKDKLFQDDWRKISVVALIKKAASIA
jgi:hypothetical protein